VGNSYVTGYFVDNAMFGTNSLAGFGGEDIFVAKYDPAGEPLWAVRAGGTNDYDVGDGVAADAAGNCYVTGSFYGTGFFGPTNLVSTPGSTDIFVAKYDPTGNLAWVRQAGSTQPNTGSGNSGAGIAVDAQRNCYVSGRCTGCPTFGILTKYDPSGNVLWAQGVGAGPDFAGGGIALDGHGGVYLAGTESSVGVPPRMFLWKYNTNGNSLWSITASGPGQSLGYDTAVAPSGDVFLCGQFTGMVTIAGETLTSQAYDGFVAKYDPGGNPLWVRQLGGTNSFVQASAVASDLSGNCFIAGSFADRLSSSVTNLVTVGGEDAFVAKYGAAGDLMWIIQIGGTNKDNALGIAWSPRQGLYVTGVFTYHASFGGAPLDSNGGGDMFLARIEELPILSVTNTADSVVVSWPTNVLGFSLEKATNSLPASQWSAVTNAVSVSGDQFVVTEQVSGSSSFYRLRKP
jgi:hypothetical protein